MNANVSKTNTGKLLAAVLVMAMVIAGAAVVFSEESVDAATSTASIDKTLNPLTDAEISTDGDYYATGDITAKITGGTVNIYLVNGAEVTFSSATGTIKVYAATNGSAGVAPTTCIDGLSLTLAGSATTVTNTNNNLVVANDGVAASGNEYRISVKGSTNTVFYGTGANAGTVNIVASDVVTVIDGSVVVSQAVEGASSNTLNFRNVTSAATGTTVTVTATDATKTTLNGTIASGTVSVTSGTVTAGAALNVVKTEDTVKTSLLNAVASNTIAQDVTLTSSLGANQSFIYGTYELRSTLGAFGDPAEYLDVTVTEGSTFIINNGVTASVKSLTSTAGTTKVFGNRSFTGDVAFMQANPNEAQNVKYDFSITGGSFTSEAADPETGEKYPAVMTDEADADKFADQKFVSGGSFSSPVDEYMPEGISTETDDDGNVVVLQPVRFTEDGISVFTSRFTLPIVIPEGATDITYTFISNDDENAATIDKDGIVTINWSHSYIMATVTATFNGVEYTDTMDILVYRDGEVTTTDSDAGIMVSYTKKAHEEYEERDDQVIDVPVEITYPVVVDIKRADTGTEPVTVDVTDLLDHFLDGTIDGTYGHDVGEYDVLTAHFGDDVDYPVTEIYDGRVYVTMEDFSTYVFYVYQVEPDPKPDPTPGWSDDDELPPFIPTQTGGDGDTVTIVACAAAAAVAAIMAVFLIIDRKK